MFKYSCTLFLSFFLVQLSAQSENIVFESGKEGYTTYRIPAIIQLPNHKIIAFAEGRVNGGADFGNIKIVMRTSKDKGKTWSKMSKVVSYGNLQAGNPAPVVDRFDPTCPNGKIYLFYNTGNVAEMELRKGKGIREVWYVTSTDGGDTWSQPVNITSQVHYPNGQRDDRVYASPLDWRTYANTPGHATQCLEGKYKGRIYIPANHSQGEIQSSFRDYASHAYYTDDHGKTFKIANSLQLPGSNEATAAFLTNGRLIMNARNQQGQVKSRIVAFSRDGGESFDTAYYDLQLPDPICQGTILNIGTKNKKSILAFVNAADTLYRNQLSLKISFNEGLDWPIHRLIDQTEDILQSKQDYSSYSDIIQTGKNEIGVLYEKQNYSKIVFKLVKW